MSPDKTNDQRVEELDNFDDQWTSLLKMHSVHTRPEVVRKIAERVVRKDPLHPLYAYKQDGPKPIAGKGTVYKVKRLVESGSLDPLLRHWGLIELGKGGEKEDPVHTAHLRALRGFLKKQATTRSSDLVPAIPSWGMSWALKNSVASGSVSRMWVPRIQWLSFPIAKRIRNHCPQHRLWKNIDDWESKNPQYYRLLAKIARRLVDDFRSEQPYPSSDLLHAEEVRFLLETFNWLAGQLLGSVPPLPKPIEPPDDAARKGILPDTVSNYSAEWLEKALKQWENAEDIRSAMHLYQYLGILGETISKDMEQIDEEVLAQGSCSDCPSLEMT